MSELNDKLSKIRELALSNDLEDKDLAKKWLTQLTNETEANANLYLLTFMAECYDTDDAIKIDENNFFKMVFRTYSIYFGKDYRYEIRFVAKYEGVIILDEQFEFSRGQVREDYHTDRFLDLLYKYFQSKEIKLHPYLLWNLAGSLELIPDK